MTNPESSLQRIDIDAKDRLVALGAEITHNPGLSVNAALLAVLGEYEATKKRVKELEKAMTRPTPAPVPA